MQPQFRASPLFSIRTVSLPSSPTLCVNRPYKCYYITLPSIGDVNVAGMNKIQKSYFSTTLVQTAVLGECDRSIIYVVWNELRLKLRIQRGRCG